MFTNKQLFGKLSFDIYKEKNNMPVIKSAIKQMKKSETARKKNREVKAVFRNKIKAVQKDLKGGGSKAQGLTSEAYAAIDKAAKNNIIHKKTAARKKSRLTLSVNKSIGKQVELKSNKVKQTNPIKTKKAAPKVGKSKTSIKPTKKAL